MSSTESGGASASEEVSTWQFGQFLEPAAEALGQLPEVTEEDGCSCTSAVGAGGAFRQ